MNLRFADVTGQTDKLNPRHVDIEANSGMSTLMTENPLESTGTGLGLHISASVIDHISAQESHSLEHSHSIAVQEPCQNSGNKWSVNLRQI